MTTSADETTGEITTDSQPDGRAARWDVHRVERRRALVADTLRAIREHGPGVDLGTIAARAGTSKPVLYRHFGDRTGLYLAVVDWVRTYIMDTLRPALENASDPLTLIRDLSEAYFSVVTQDRNIYQFVNTHPGLPATEDPISSLSDQMGTEIGTIIAQQLRARGDDAAMAITWGHGIVGFVRGAANSWLENPDSRSPRLMIDDIVNFFSRVFPPSADEPSKPQPSFEPHVTSDDDSAITTGGPPTEAPSSASASRLGVDHTFDSLTPAGPA